MRALSQSGGRVELGPDDTPFDIRRLAENDRVKVLQFSQPLAHRTFDSLNEDFFSRRPEVELRAYGFYGGVCDLEFCARLSNVERFRADCLHHATGFDHIAEMSRLRLLGIGIWNLESFDFLNDVTDGVREMVLLATKSKKPDLRPLVRFRGLRKLFLNSQQKSIEVLAGHPSIDDLALSSITLKSLDLLRTLPKLRRLAIVLGGCRDLSALDGLESIADLEMWRIRQLTDISVLSTLRGLQRLVLEDQPRIVSLPSLTQLSALRKVSFDGMKDLVDVAALASAPAMQELIHTSAKTEPEDYVPILKHRGLRFAWVKFGNQKKNSRFEELCNAAGVTVGVNREFALI